MHFERQNAFQNAGKNIILCILKGKMPFKMHKIMFFPEKKLKKICVPIATLPKIFRPVTRNTLIFFIWPKETAMYILRGHII